MMLIDSEHKVTETVYLTTDTEQRPRLVTAILVRESHIMYYLSCGTEETSHYHFEISKEINILLTTNN
jgi:hypothetical protein